MNARDRDGKAPALFVRAFCPVLRESIAKRAADLVEQGPNACDSQLSLERDALDWLLGRHVDRDCKIEVRQAGGIWSAHLLAGVMGYSASVTVATVAYL